VQCLTELKIVFTAEDLRTPMPTKVQYLFETFVLEMMGLRREVVEPIAQALSEDQQYPEVHYDSLVFLAFYRSLVQLMESAGISDFTFDDITKPTTERLRLILSSVINMFRFKSERMPVIERYLEKSDSITETVEKLCIENDDLARRLEELKAQRKREEPAIEEALEENRKLAGELRGLKQKETLRTMESDKVKQEKSSHISALKNFRYLVETNQRECQKLQPYIVDSPEKLQQVIGDLGKTLQKEREAVDNAERQARALKISADSFSIVEADVTSCIKLMEDCEKEMIKQDEIVRKVQRQQEVLQEKDTEAKELTRKEEVIDVVFRCRPLFANSRYRGYLVP
jgi:kinetochore protein Nuf2